MTLSFEFGESSIFLYDNRYTTNDELWAATRAMANRMRDELWGYFGLAVVAAGSWPTLTLSFASGGDREALRAATAQVFANTGSWQVARGRLSAFIRGDGSLRGHRVRVSQRAFSQPDTLMAWETLASGHRQGGVGTRLVVNPYTYFYANGQSSMRFSSERARAAESATLHLLHELTHLWGPMFASSANSDEEQQAVLDVDTAVSGHRGIALRRRRYGSYGERTNVFVADQTPEWVIWPQQAVLLRGR